MLLLAAVLSNLCCTTYHSPPDPAAAALQFVALVGALGFTPLDFILPVLLFMAAKKTSLWWKALNVFLAVAYTVVSILGAVGAFYFIIDHARTYQLFADL